MHRSGPFAQSSRLTTFLITLCIGATTFARSPAGTGPHSNPFDNQPDTSHDVSFAAPQLIPFDQQILAFEIADFDNDGDADLLVKSYRLEPDQRAVWTRLVNDGAGHFNPMQESLPLSNGFVVGADFDGNCSTELVLAGVPLNDNTGALRLMLLSNESVLVDEVLDPPTYDLSRTGVHPNDLDDDGDLDLVLEYLGDFGSIATGSDPSSFWADVLNEPGVVAVLQRTTTGFAETYVETFDGLVRDVVVADLNGDNAVDLAILVDEVTGSSHTPDTGHIQIRLNNGDQTYRPASPPELRSVLMPTGLAAVDVDLDGDTDLLVLGHTTGSEWSTYLYHYPNDGNAHFAEPATSEVPDLRSATLNALQTTDANHDGLPDVVAFGHGQELTGAAFEVLINQGDGYPAVADRYGATWQDQVAMIGAIADLNGDGWEDVLVAAYWRADADRDWLQYWLNTRDGKFGQDPGRQPCGKLESPARTAGLSFATTFKAADLTNDGTAELIGPFIRGVSNELNVFRNTTPPPPAPPTPPPPTTPPTTPPPPTTLPPTLLCPLATFVLPAMFWLGFKGRRNRPNR